MFYGEFINEVKDLPRRTEQIYIYGLVCEERNYVIF